MPPAGPPNTHKMEYQANLKRWPPSTYQLCLSLFKVLSSLLVDPDNWPASDQAPMVLVRPNKPPGMEDWSPIRPRYGRSTQRTATGPI